MMYFDSSADFRDWLQDSHAARDELWVGYWKKATGRPSMTWEESVDEALCFGWIDGIRKRVDDDAYTIRFTPRRPGSIWSQRNIKRYAALAAAGRIEPAGKDAFSRGKAKNSGTSSTLPDEYLERLRSRPAAWADWQSRPPGYRRLVAGWITSARRETTRERRLVALIEDSAAGRKIKPLRL